MRSPHDEALALLARAPYVHLASTTREGAPLLRAVHGAVCDGMLCFHGSPVGEKTEAEGRPAVIGYEELVAEIPSYWTDAEMACPATSLYVSAQAHGTLRSLESPAQKSRALQALMEKYQPEGGHAPITDEDARYRKPVAGVAVWGLSLDRVDGKHKLAQNRSRDYVRTVVERLWERGRDGDPRAIELLLEANTDVQRPAFLQGPHGTSLHAWSDPRALPDALPLLRDEYWNRDRFDDPAITTAHDRSSAWVIARDPDGSLVATARAVTDSVKYAYLGDVSVRADWRGRGVGAALLSLLLAHPMVRRVARVELATRDAVRFYERAGFSLVSEQRVRGFVRHTMALLR